MSNFEPCPKEVVDLIDRVYRKHHRDRLVVLLIDRGEEIEVEPTFRALFKTGAPLRHQGYDAAATIRITGKRERALGIEDVLITIDQFTWRNCSADRKRALIDHELTHLVLRGVDEAGVALPKKCLDDTGRPKLALRKHDFQIGGFNEVIERHGEAAFEAEQVARSASRHRQLVIPWLESQTALGATGTDDVSFTAADAPRLRAIAADARRAATPETPPDSSNGPADSTDDAQAAALDPDSPNGNAKRRTANTKSAGKKKTTKKKAASTK